MCFWCNVIQSFDGIGFWVVDVFVVDVGVPQDIALDWPTCFLLDTDQRREQVITYDK